MTDFLLVPLRLTMVFLPVKGGSLDMQGMIQEEWFVNTDPRTERLKPRLLPGCEICELLAPGWIALLRTLML